MVCKSWKYKCTGIYSVKNTMSNYLKIKESKTHSTDWLQKGEKGYTSTYVVYKNKKYHSSTFVQYLFVLTIKTLRFSQEEGEHIPWMRLLWSSLTETSLGVLLGKLARGSSGQRTQVFLAVLLMEEILLSVAYISWLFKIINSFVFIQIWKIPYALLVCCIMYFVFRLFS